jgi:hypothetical protein
MLMSGRDWKSLSVGLFACEQLVERGLRCNQMGRRALLFLDEKCLDESFRDLVRAFSEVMSPSGFDVSKPLQADWTLRFFDEI